MSKWNYTAITARTEYIAVNISRTQQNKTQESSTSLSPEPGELLNNVVKNYGFIILYTLYIYILQHHARYATNPRPRVAF